MTDPSVTVAPALTDGVVRLRAHTLHDVDAIVEQSLDADSQRFTSVPRRCTRGGGHVAHRAPRLPWFEPPVMDGSGIRLRPWRDEDIHAVEERNDPEHWMPPRSVLAREMFPRWLLGRRELMSEARSVEWCIADAATDRALGGVTVLSRGGPMSGDVAELGYQLFPSGRGRGAARTAARLAIRHALTPIGQGGLGLRRLVAETAADNAASSRVLESNGFVVYGREHAVDPLPDGTYGDGLHWELLPDGADS